MAELLEAPPGTVKSYLHRARLWILAYWVAAAAAIGYIVTQIHWSSVMPTNAAVIQIAWIAVGAGSLLVLVEPRQVQRVLRALDSLFGC